jgi:hypothetical protein
MVNHKYCFNILFYETINLFCKRRFFCKRRSFCKTRYFAKEDLFAKVDILAKVIKKESWLACMAWQTLAVVQYVSKGGKFWDGQNRKRKRKRKRKKEICSS